MGAIAVVGESPHVEGFGLAGVRVFVAATPAAVHEAWRQLPADVDVVILTAAAAAAIDAEHRCGPPYPVVLPP
jgi:vacuolar-type H+-ATPase subunit F/Vma7